MKTVFTNMLSFALFFLLGAGTGYAQLSGNYTIDATGSGSNNYTSVVAAVSALNSNGVSGPATFTIANGTYTGQVSFTSTISGINYANRVTFKGKSGNPSDVVITNASTYTIYGTAGDFITFEDVTIQNTYAYSYNIYLRGSDKFIFDNCIIEKQGGSNFNYNIYNLQSDSTTLLDCEVNGGYYGMRNWGFNTSSGITTIVKNTEFYNQVYYPSYNYYSEGNIFENNIIDSVQNTGYIYGYFSYYGHHSSIKSNQFRDCGMNLSYENRSSNSDTSAVFNNMFGNTTGGYALYGFYQYNTKVYNNSLYFNGPNYGLYLYQPTGSRYVNNNIEGDASIYGIYVRFTPLEFDYNNIYVSGGNSWGYFNSSTYSSLAALKTGQTSYNQNSISTDPDYDDDARNLRSYCPLVNNSGDLRITTDIDGNKRPNSTDDPKTDIGCNEFYVAPKDLDIKAITSPLSVGTGSNTITAVFRNSGSTTLTNEIVTFQYSTDSGKTWTSQTDTITLAPKANYNLSFNQTWTPTRSGSFRIYVKADKSVSGDPDTKDEMFIDVCSGLSGTYTVGRPGSNFLTLAAAFKKLECGLSGHTTFQLAGGSGGTQATYGQLKIKDLIGTSANATLTIDGVSADSVRISHTTGSTYDGAIVINNSDFVIVKNMEVRHNPNYVGVFITNGADNNTVENLDVSCTQSSYYMSANLAMTGSGYTTATNVDNNVIKNCSFKGAYYGANMRSSTGGSFNNIVEGCTFDDFYYSGLYLRYQDSLSLIGNEVVKNGNLYQYGYNTYTYYNTRSNIVGNYFEGHSYGGLFMYYENNGTSNRSLIANNIINGKQYYCSRGYVALDIYFYSRNVDVYHNTVISDPCGSTTSIGFGQNAAMRLYYTTDCNIENNILISLDNTGSGVPFIDYRSFSIGDFDHNTYITNSSNLGTQLTSSISNLAAMQNTWAGSNLNSNVDPVTFVGNGDYHLTTTKDSKRAPIILGITDDIDGDTRCTFAASIGADESNYPTPKTRAFFAASDTVYVKSPTQFSNAYKKTDPVVNNWYVDGNYAGSTVDLEYRFQATGTYNVKVITEGCGGLDSFTQSVVAILPTKVPSTGFLTSHTVIDVNDVVSFTNLTTNGPDSFFWRVDSNLIMGPFGFRVRSNSFVNGTSPNSTHAEIEFLYPGTYTICLRAKNIRGEDSTCKPALITVRQTDDLCGINDFSTHRIGKLFDEGGPTGNYIANRPLCTYLIDPCTDEIKLTFNEFNLASGSILRIYDGKNNLGKPLYDYDPAFANGLTGDMTKLANFRRNLTATSGEVFVEFSSGNAVASGFELEWEGRLVTAYTPVVDFALPDTVCANVPFAVVNNTQGLDVDFEWIMDNANANWSTPIDYDTEDITHKYSTAGTYEVKLRGINCSGKDSLVDSIVVIAPKTAPTPSFTVSNSRPAIGDAVTFTDASTSKIPCIGAWEWSVTPSTYAFAGGFNKNSQNPQIFFQDTGYYDVTLKVTNSAGSNSYTMTQAVYSISVCVPSVKITGTSVGISRVVIGDIDNSSNIGQTGYQNFISETSTILEKGASYDITIERPTGGTNPMNRAVWVDYNQDGVFDNTTEMVVSSSSDNNQTWTGTFTVDTMAINGPTRLRVGANLGKFKQYGCGPNQFGEFEDYRVFVTDDSQAPVIVFYGAQDTTIEQCSKWTDPGAYGLDNVNGIVPLTGTFGGVNTAVVGTYSIVYKAKDKSDNEGQGTRTVKVVTDYTNPVLTLQGNNPETLEVKSTYIDAGANADDNCGGNISADIVVSGVVNDTKLGTYFITYDITDVAGNSASMTREVKVVDTQAPVITLNGKAIDTIEVNTVYNEAGVSATDNYDLVLDYIVKGTVDVNTLGTYELKYTTSDASGNVSNELTRIVVVIDGTAPVIRLAYGTDTTILVEVYDKYTPEYVDIDDNYSSESAVRGTEVYGGTYVTRFGAGATTELGDYTFTYTYQDESGNVTTVTRDIKVVDTEAPTAILTDGTNSITLYRWDSFDPLADVTMTLDDNFYGEDVLTIDFISSDVNTQSTGQYQVVYEIADPSGNILTYTVDVTVADSETTIGVKRANIVADIYPNPTNGQLNINVDLLKAGRVRVSVINSLGQEVITVADQMAHVVNQTVDLTTLGSGIYYIQIVSGNDRLIEKVTLTD